jgi:glucan phosphoethanolaminetransferase (alkaline phosphatase superfamily)
MLSKLLPGFAALVLAAPIPFAAYFAWLADWEPWRVAGLALTSLAVLALPVVLCRTTRQVLWLYLPVAVYAALILGVMPALSFWPHEGALVAMFATSGAGLIEGISSFAPFVGLSALLALAYVVACLQPAKAIPGRLKRGILLSAAAYALAGYGIGRYWTLPSLFATESLERSYPLALGFDLWRLAERKHSGKETHRFHAFKPTTHREREIYVLVLGESSRYDHWQVNGYPRATSPRLMTYGPDRLVSFADVTAVANLTLVVWPLALSRATVEHQQPAAAERSIVSLFKEAGFETAWISNQNGSVDQSFEADRRTFLNRAWQTAWDCYDTALLPLLHEELARGARRQFIVVHLMGNHGDYRFRYTKRHDVFGDHARAGGVYKVSDAGRLRDYYDNSILANDEILDEIVKQVEAEQAVSTVVFMGDHGENLMDDERHMVWHGTATSSRAEVHIPFFVFPGERWRQANPALLANLKANRRRPVIQTTLFPTLAQLAGIGYPGAEPARSVADSRYQPPVQRLTLRNDKSPVDVSTLR